MKRSFSLILILFFYLSLNIRAGNWEWLSGGDFNDIKAVSASEIWLGGELLVKGVKDSLGWHWSQVGTDVTDNNTIKRISFFDSVHGMLLTDKNIFYTSDGGNSWLKFSYPSSYTFNDIQMTGENSAYAAGVENAHYGQGVILKTTDNGKTWELLYKTNIYYGGSFTQLKVWGNGHAIAVGTFYDGWGSFGAVFETENDWKTAGKSFESSEHDLWGLFAPTEKDIYVRGGRTTDQPYIAYIHRDKSNNWQSAQLPGDVARIDGLFFDTSEHGWGVGYFDNATSYEKGAVILETSDGGATWKEKRFSESFPSLDALDSSPVNATILNLITMAGEDIFIGQSYYNNAYPCFNNECTGAIFYSKDKGKTFQRVDKLSGYNYTSATAFDENGELISYIVGKNFGRTLLIKTYDTTISTPHIFNFFCTASSIAMTSSLDGWVGYCTDKTYSNFYILHTIDGGTTWSMQQINNVSPYPIDKIKVSAYKGSVAIGLSYSSNSPPYLLRSSNYGESWSIDSMDTNFKVDSLYQVDESTICYLYGYGLYCSRDYGNTWSLVSIDNDKYESFTLLQFANDKIGYILRQSDNMLFKTVDTANSWMLSGYFPHNSGDYFMKFINEKYGYIVDGNNLKITSDGGATWKNVNDGVNPDKISNIVLTKDLKGIAYTPSGLIIINTYGDTNISSENNDYCAFYNSETGELFYPCVNVNGQKLILSFKLANFSPVIIELDNYGLLPISDVNNKCADFNINNMMLYTDCLKVGEKKYQLNFKLIKNSPVQLQLNY